MEGNVRIIIESEDSTWKVTANDKFSDKLMWEEMMGLVSSLTIPDRKPCLQWLLTQEQHDARNKMYEDKMKDICQE